MIQYIWVQEYKNLKNIGFNLSSKKNFHFELDAKSIDKQGSIISGELKSTDITSYIDVFNYDNIDDIKIIIGENGAGKTSLIELIHEVLFTGGLRRSNAFIVIDNVCYYKGDKFNIKCNKKIKIKKGLDLLNEERKRKQQREFEHEQYNYSLAGVVFPNLYLFNYSNLFNKDNISNYHGLLGITNEYENGTNFIDISLTETIIKDSNTNSDNTNRFLSIINENLFLKHKINESIRYLHLLNNKNIKDQIIHPFFKVNIETINFRINSNVSERFIALLDERDNEEYFFLNNLAAINVSSFEDSFIKELLFVIVLFDIKTLSNYGHDHDTSIISITSVLLDSVTKGKINIKEVLYEYLNERIKKDYLRLKDLDDRIKQIFKVLKEVDYLFSDTEVLEISLNNVKDINKLIKIFYLSDRDSIICNFIEIEFKGLSSGEINILSLFSRFYWRAQFLNSTKNKQILCILDEPEIGLHPQWQVDFIKYVLKFFNLIFKDNRVQIILTSHSPILLSDFPLENVLYLSKNKENNSCQIAEGVKTFGANIHSLYQNSFFLNNGKSTMGSFSKEYIQNLIKEINNLTGESSILERKINIVGDDFLRAKLFSLLTNRKYSILKTKEMNNYEDFIKSEYSKLIK